MTTLLLAQQYYRQGRYPEAFGILARLIRQEEGVLTTLFHWLHLTEQKLLTQHNEHPTVQKLSSLFEKISQFKPNRSSHCDSVISIPLEIRYSGVSRHLNTREQKKRTLLKHLLKQAQHDIKKSFYQATFDDLKLECSVECPSVECSVVDEIEDSRIHILNNLLNKILHQKERKSVVALDFNDLILECTIELLVQKAEQKDQIDLEKQLTRLLNTVQNAAQRGGVKKTHYNDLSLDCVITLQSLKKRFKKETLLTQLLHRVKYQDRTKQYQATFDDLKLDFSVVYNRESHHENQNVIQLENLLQRIKYQRDPQVRVVEEISPIYVTVSYPQKPLRDRRIECLKGLLNRIHTYKLKRGDNDVSGKI